jgi:DNA repair photolyase
MNDPYMPLERRLELTRRALSIIAEFGFPVHVITNSDLVVRELDLLRRISRVYASVSFTVTMADEDLAAKVEPFAPRPSVRFAAMRAPADAGVQTGVTMMPILPFIEDTRENLAAIVTQAAESGTRYVLPWLGMSLRDRQRAYYYRQLDRHFPGLRARYERTYGERYSCDVPNAAALYQYVEVLAEEHGLVTEFPQYAP